MAKLYTWGTGASFGRELGVPKNRDQRGHTASSIIIDSQNENDLHYLIDAGAPCVETMIDQGISSVPDALFFTHSHSDHTSDFDKLANSAKRGRLWHKWTADKIGEKPKIGPLFIICTDECLNNPDFGLKKKFSYLEEEVKLIKWIPIPSFDVWYSISKSDGSLIPTGKISENVKYFSIEFKALLVNHAPTAPGSCLYIFRFKDEKTEKKVVISGDFERIEDCVLKNGDLEKPDILLLETNTLYATGTNHTNWLQNMQLIKQWQPKSTFLNHLSGFEDWEQCFLNDIPDNNVWTNVIKNFANKNNFNVNLADDGNCYPI